MSDPKWFGGEVNKDLVDRLIDERITKEKRIRKAKMKRKHKRQNDRGGRLKQ